MRIMSERSAGLDEATMKVGLLMESAQVHQKLAEGQLEQLRAHTRDLDVVVRDEIRRTLVEELQMLSAETTRATRTLEKLKRSVGLRSTLWSLLAAFLFALVPVAAARWTIPTAADIDALRAQRDELSANLAKLEKEGGRISWRYCGESRRLCFRVDRKAPTYGENGDFLVVAGY
jgi:hypothetical protein